LDAINNPTRAKIKTLNFRNFIIFHKVPKLPENFREWSLRKIRIFFKFCVRFFLGIGRQSADHFKMPILKECSIKKGVEPEGVMIYFLTPVLFLQYF